MSLAGRPSVRVDHVHGNRMVTNPSWPEEHGEIVAACHDRTPCMDFYCDCGAMNHVHESQFEGMPGDVTEVALRCHACREPMIVSASYLRAGFADTRRMLEPTG